MIEYEEQVRKFYSEIWDRKNYNEIPNVLHSNFVFRGSLGDEKTGHDGFKQYVEYVHSCLSNYKCTIEDIVIQQNKVFTKMNFTGIHSSEFLGFSPTNREVSWVGAALFTFSGNKVSNLWVLGDLKNLESQLENKT